MSFVTREGIIRLIEELLIHCWPEDKPSINIPFPRMTYEQAMRLYGTDKPDTRFDIKVRSYELFNSYPFPKQALVFMFLLSKSSENTVGKGEIARNEQFLLFPQCFLSFGRTFCHIYQI